MDFAKKKKNRELVLTTLIDLLVQIIFIFTIVLIIRVSTEAGKNGQSSNENIPEVWNSLVRALDLDKDNSSNEEKKKKIIEMKEERDRLRKKLDSGAPGKPLCLNNEKKAVDFVVEVKIVDDSIVSVYPTNAGMEIINSNKLLLSEGNLENIPLANFRKRFKSWGDYQNNKGCQYRAVIRYSNNVSAHSLSMTQKTVGEYFYQSSRSE